ncbi:hypothetical protein DFH08DRAFT_798823 [Mycena albidolilacea]|uniref:Uncharacterized protein n=1 Tax=Mycena albidolilacea TaxID=1033008 RepID=A0AAD7APG3_9AGAR|nr:hypothetical protein DFH08DRAFT_798823 [Mycena albidolilacea]
MCGFVSGAGYPVTTKKQLEDSDLGPEFLKAIWSVDAEDIKDKSKGDALSKGVALAQGLWFTNTLHACTVFGAIHCAAWNNNFLTATEMWIWKSCSVGIAANPVIGFLTIRLSFQINETAFEKTKLGEAITSRYTAKIM